jgi:acetyl esterase/lipase
VRTRREFLREVIVGAGVGAGALALGGCSKADSRTPGLQGLQQLKYGPANAQIGELLVPDGKGPFPVVVLIHGGWWRVGWDRRAGHDLARDLLKHGYASWNLDYRPVGEPGGGWPGTFEDIANGIDSLVDHASEYHLDLKRLVFVGHSAGGQLALWAAARGEFPAGSLGSGPRLLPNTVVAQAPVTDLELAADWNLGQGAVQHLLGGTPAQVPDRYRAASPIDLLPMKPPQFLIHSIDDDVIPVEQSRLYAKVGKEKHDQVELVQIPSGGHYWLIDVTGDAWKQVRDRMDEFFARPPIVPATRQLR